MISKSTVFIVGAGASKELKLPLGSELLGLISDATTFRFGHINGMESGDEVIAECLTRTFRPDAKKYFESAPRLRSVIPLFRSIDEALHYLSHDAQAISLGKIAIARLITAAERNSTLFQRADRPWHARGSWLPEFLSLVLSSHSKTTAATAFDSVSIISFNYDRVIEEFLFHALQANALMERPEAVSLIRKLKIIRPYGRLGPLPWDDATDPFPFGGVGERQDDYSAVAKNIRTFTEQTGLDGVRKEIDDMLYRAKVIVFLGFGFHGQNLELLRVSPRGEKPTPSKTIFATFCGVPDENKSYLKERIEALFPSSASSVANLYNFKANELLINMHPTISALVA